MYWATYGLPGLDIGWSTYKIIEKSLLPDIEVAAKWQQYNSLDDFDAGTPSIDSPTACYFSINKDDNSFYKDQQDCIVWHYKPDVGVYLDNNEKWLVSRTLPEFLSRLDLEARVWFKGDCGTMLQEDEQKYLAGIKELNDNTAVAEAE